MPSLLHEGIIALVREDPAFAASLLRDLLHVPLPNFTSAVLSEASLNELVPTEYRADAVVLLVDDKPVFGIIFEAQLRVDPDKLLAWPTYAVNARARHGCPFVVLVVTPDLATVRWAAQPIALGGGTWQALVVGPDGIPPVTDVEQAIHHPHLAVLSIMAHGRDDNVSTALAIANAATVGAAALPEAMRVLCYDLIESSLGEAVKRTFAMLPQGQRFFSENQRRWFEGGEAKGRAVGKTEGRSEGKAEGKAEAVLLVLEGRGLSVSPEQRQRVLRCSDMATLEGWLRKAATVETIDRLFA